MTKNKQKSKTPKSNLSLTTTNLYYQMVIAFALMTVLPILAITSFLVLYLLPDILSRQSVMLVILFSLILSSIAFAMLTNITRSLTRLAQYIRAIADGNLTAPQKISNGSKEIDDIIESIGLILRRLQEEERMSAARELAAAAADADRKRAAEQEKAYDALRNAQQKLVQSEKLASVGRLAATIAHEMNNPLASILLGAQRIRDKIRTRATDIPDSQDYLRTLDRIERATKRSHGIVAGLLAFSRPTELESAPANINRVVEETLESLEDQVKAQNIKVFTEFARDLPMVKADAHKLSQVFNNLIINACDTMSKGGQLRIATRLRKPGADPPGEGQGKGAESVEIEFTDTGKGIPEEVIPRIFEPFFTTKTNGKGTGLGLFIAYAIIKAHGGAIEVTSKENKGSTFIVMIPVDR